MAEAIGASATLTASGAYVHSGVGPSSNSASSTGGTPITGSVALAVSGDYVSSGVGPPSNSALATGGTPFGTAGIDVSPFWQLASFEFDSTSVLVELVPIEYTEPVFFELGVTSVAVELVTANLVIAGVFEFDSALVAIELVPIEAPGSTSFEFGSTSVLVEPVDADLAIGSEGDPVFATTPIGVELVPIEAFATSSFEFGVTPVAVFGTFLDLLSGGAGGRFELGATDIALTGVPLEYFQDFSPFELGVAPVTVTLIDANLYALPPAVLVPPAIAPPGSPSGSPLAPTTREFEPPRYAVTLERSMNGLSEPVLWGSKPGGAKMALGYKAVEDAWAEAWMKLYDASREVSPLDLPSEVYGGLSVGLTNIYNLTKYGLRWFFAKPPRIESVKRGFSAIDIDLEGRNANPLPYGASGFLAVDPTLPVVITDIGDPYVPLPDGDVTDVDLVPPFWLFQVTNESYDPTGDPGGVARSGQAFFDGGIVSTDDGFVTLAGGEGAPAAYGQVHIQGWGEEGNRLWTASFSNGLTNRQDFPVQLVRRSDGRYSAAIWRSFPGATLAGDVEKCEIITCGPSGESPSVASFIIDTATPAGTYCSAMVEDGSGNLWVVYCSHNTNPDIFSVVTKISPSMSVIASRKYSISGTEIVIRDLVEANDGSGDMFFVGDTGRPRKGEAVFPPFRMIIGRLEADLSGVAWSNSYNATDFPSSGVQTGGRSIALGPSSTLIVVGDVEHTYYAPSNFIYNTFVAKISQLNGAVVSAQWLRQSSRELSGEGDPFPWTKNSARKIYQDSDGNYLIGMTAFKGVNQGRSYAVINIDSALAIRWQYELAADSNYSNPNTSYQIESNSNNPLAVSPSGNVLFHGSVPYESNSALPVTVSVPTDFVFGVDVDERFLGGATAPWIRSCGYQAVSVSLSASSVTLGDSSHSVTASTASYSSVENDPTFTRLGEGVPPPSLDGATPIVVPAITYTQSSVYPGQTAASNAEMTDGSGDELYSTGTDDDATGFVMMDLGGKRIINNVIIGADSNNLLVGVYGASYTSNLALEYSEDGTTWFDLAVAPATWPTPIQTISGLNVAGRYIRIVKYDGYLAVTEFYATTD